MHLPPTAPPLELDVRDILTLDEFESRAQTVLSEMAFEYATGGVADGVTVAANRAAFQRISLLPRVLVDVSRIDTTCSLLGRRHTSPILLAPTGYHKLFHNEGELETVRGADRAATLLVASTFSTVHFAEMSSAARLPLWMQLYLQPDRAITKDLVAMAADARCEALCLTVDVPVNGPRDHEIRLPFKLPAGVERANLRALGRQLSAAAHRPSGTEIYTPVRAANATWRDVEWLRQISPMALLLKGILNAEDARLAVEHGCAGILVSNHGGRSLDTVPATIDVLPAIVAAVSGKCPILLDGGIRRGTDIVKALALGASAVLIGRPYLYGLAVAGSAGIARVVEILQTELAMSMGLLGVTELAQIGPEVIWNQTF